MSLFITQYAKYRFVTVKKDGVIWAVNILEQMMFDTENENIQDKFWFVHLIFHASVLYGFLEILDHNSSASSSEYI